MAAGIYFWTAVAHPNWWLRTVTIPMHNLDSLRFGPIYCFSSNPPSAGSMEVMYNTIIVLTISFLALVTVINNLMMVRRELNCNTHRPRRLRNDTTKVTRLPFLRALCLLLPFSMIILFSILWIGFSPDGIFQKNPRIVTWTVGLFFCKLVTHLMIAHLCAAEYFPLRRTLIPPAVFAIHLGAEYMQGNEMLINESTLLYEFFALSLIAYAHLVFCVIDEMKTVLGVYCFSITVKPKVTTF